MLKSINIITDYKKKNILFQDVFKTNNILAKIKKVYIYTANHGL